MADSPKSPSDLPFGAFLTYSPRGSSTVSARARDIVYAIKQDRPGVIAAIVDRMLGDLDRSALVDFFGNDVTLVPAPRSSLLPKKGPALWPSRRICEELVRKGLGAEFVEFVERIIPVPKSAYAVRGERPGLQKHIDSLKATRRLLKSSRVTVVDDVVT